MGGCERMTTATPPVLDHGPRARRRTRGYEFIPELALAAGLGWFAITEPRAATSAFRSGHAVLLMAVVAVVWVALRFVATRFARHPLASAVLFGIGALFILKIVVLPAYQNHTVVETLDLSRGATVLRTGPLHGIDHRANGTVRIYRDGDGRFIVGLVDFSIQPGPKYVVYIAEGADRRSLRRSTRLAGLRGNRGTQFYDVPAGFELDRGPWTVLVWCQIFDVPIANSTPA
jgi:hypothetical protein